MVESSGLSFDFDSFFDNISVCSKDGDRKYDRISKNIKLVKEMVAKASQVGKVKYMNKWRLVNAENELEKLTKDHSLLIEEHIPLQKKYQAVQLELNNLKENNSNADSQLQALRHHSNQLQALVKELEDKLDASNIEKNISNSSGNKKDASIKLMKHLVTFGKIAAKKGKLTTHQKKLLSTYMEKIGDPSDIIDTDIKDLDNLEMPLSCGSVDTGISSAHASGDEKIWSPDYQCEPVKNVTSSPKSCYNLDTGRALSESSDSESEPYTSNKTSVIETPENIPTRTSPRKSPRISPIKKHVSTSPHKLWLEINKSPKKKPVIKHNVGTSPRKSPKIERKVTKKCNAATSPIKRPSSPLNKNEVASKCDIGIIPLPENKDTCINKKRRESIQCDIEVDNILKEMITTFEHISPLPSTPINVKVANRRNIMKSRGKYSKKFNIKGEVQKLKIQNLKLNRELCLQRKQMFMANKVLLKSQKRMLNSRKLNDVELAKISQFIKLMDVQSTINKDNQNDFNTKNKTLMESCGVKSPRKEGNGANTNENPINFSSSHHSKEIKLNATELDNNNTSNEHKKEPITKQLKKGCDENSEDKLKTRKVIELFGEDDEETDNEVINPPKRVLRPRNSNPDLCHKVTSLSTDAFVNDTKYQLNKSSKTVAVKEKRNVNVRLTCQTARNLESDDDLDNIKLSELSSAASAASIRKTQFNNIDTSTTKSPLDLLSRKSKLKQVNAEPDDGRKSFSTTRVLRKRKNEAVEKEIANSKIAKQNENASACDIITDFNKSVDKKTNEFAIKNVDSYNLMENNKINSSKYNVLEVNKTLKSKIDDCTLTASQNNSDKNEKIVDCPKTKHALPAIATRIYRKTRSSLIYSVENCNPEKVAVNEEAILTNNNDSSFEKCCNLNENADKSSHVSSSEMKGYPKERISKRNNETIKLDLDSYPLNNPVGRRRLQHQPKVLNTPADSLQIKNNQKKQPPQLIDEVKHSDLVSHPPNNPVRRCRAQLKKDNCDTSAKQKKTVKNTKDKSDDQLIEINHRKKSGDVSVTKNNVVTENNDKKKSEDVSVTENNDGKKSENVSVTDNNDATKIYNVKEINDGKKSEDLSVTENIQLDRNIDEATVTKRDNMIDNVDNNLCTTTENHFFKKMLSTYGRFVKRKTLPAKMPGAAVTKIENILEGHLGSIMEVPTCKELDNLIGVLEGEVPKVFVAALTAFLTSEKRNSDILCKKVDHRIPSMTKQEQALLYVLSKLHKKWAEFNLFDVVMRCIEYKMLRLGHTPELTQVESLSRFYAVICRFRHLKDVLRMFMVEALYCLNYKAIPVIKQCLDVWMHVLPLAHLAQARTPIVVVLMYVIFYFRVDDYKSNYMIDILKKTLSTKYSFDMKNVTEKDMLQQMESFVTSVKNNSTEKKALSIAFILLAKRKGVVWCQKHIVDGILMAALNNASTKDSVKAFCITLLGSLLKPYPDNMKLHCEMIMNKLLVMMEEKPSPAVEQAILYSLLLLRKHNITRVIKILTNWNPRGEVNPELKEQIKIVIQEMPLKQWISNLNAKNGGDCKN